MKYLVTVRAESSIVVEAEDENHAQEIAFAEADLRQFDTTEAECVCSLENPEELDRAIRHANEVIEQDK